MTKLYLSAQGSKKKEVSDEDISRAYCSLAEVYLTDSWYVCIEQNVIQISELFLNSSTKDLLFSIVFPSSVSPAQQRRSVKNVVVKQ